MTSNEGAGPSSPSKSDDPASPKIGPPSAEWLAQNAIRSSLLAAAFAFIAPLGVIGVISAAFDWRFASDPAIWAVWLPALAAVWTTFLTAGYFLITAALFQATARQARAAAEQAGYAAQTAALAAKEARLHRRAVLGTIASQEREHRRLFRSLRNVVVDRIQALEQLVSAAESGGPAIAELPPEMLKELWTGAMEDEWRTAGWLLDPELRADLIDLRGGLETLRGQLQDLKQLDFKPSYVKKTAPKLLEGARRSLERLRTIESHIMNEAKDHLPDDDREEYTE